jgi:acetyltransferase
VAETLASTMKGRRYPLVACWMGGKSIGRAVELLNETGIPTFETPERAVKAFLYMVEYARNLETLLEIPPKMTRHVVFDQEKARKCFSELARGNLCRHRMPREC